MRFFNGSLYVQLHLIEGAPFEQWRKMNQTKANEYTLVPETAAKINRFLWPGAPQGFVSSCTVHGVEQLVSEVSIEAFICPGISVCMSTINTLEVLCVKITRETLVGIENEWRGTFDHERKAEQRKAEHGKKDKEVANWKRERKATEQEVKKCGCPKGVCCVLCI